jgi:uncharacterized RDD family membrane protein YckC
MEQTLSQNDLLSDVEAALHLEHAGTGQRFINMIVDMILYYIVFVLLLAITFGLAGGGDEFLDDRSGSAKLLQYLVAYGVYVIFYGLMEGLSKGRTLGKLITKTKVLKQDGGEISFSDAWMRSLCRIVPFEAFSAFGGHPWHDRWTNTIVVKIRK